MYTRTITFLHTNIKFFYSPPLQYLLYRSLPKLRESYLHCVGSRPLVRTTIGPLLNEDTQRTPDRTAAVFCSSGSRFTFRELLKKVLKFVTLIIKMIFYFWVDDAGGLYSCRITRSRSSPWWPGWSIWAKRPWMAISSIRDC